MKIESAAASPILARCDGAQSELTLQGLDLVSTASSGSEVAHCALASNSATININDCTMRATGACCVVTRNGSMFLSGSKTFGPGGGVLAAENSFFSAEDCIFSRSRCSGVEIREGASCCFKRCEISSNNGGAITLYQGGIKATFEACKIMLSGRLQGRSAVLVGCGTLIMRGCTVQENPGDGIVVQDDDGTAHLDISNSMCNNNGSCGIVLYGGSACVSDCRIQENQMIGFACHSNSQGNTCRPFRAVRLVRNIIVGNNEGIVGSGISEKRLKQRVHLDGNQCVSLAIFHTCCNMYDMVKSKQSENSGQGINEIFEETSEEILKQALKEKEKGMDQFTFVCPQSGLIIDNATDSIESMLSRRWMKTAHVGMLNQTKVDPSMAEFAFSKQALLDSHECALKQQERQKDEPIHMYQDHGVVQATAAATMQGLSECRITDLIATVGHRARGKVLHGTVCTQSLRRRSLQTIIEDEHGDVVLVSLYNIPAIELPHWRECFPVGMKLGIRVANTLQCSRSLARATNEVMSNADDAPEYAGVRRGRNRRSRRQDPKTQQRHL